MKIKLDIPWHQYALIVTLAEKMYEKGNWFGKTALQKLVYLLGAIYKVPCGYRFSLYIHGPLGKKKPDQESINFLGDRNEDEPVFKIGAGAFISWARKCSKSTGVNFHTHRCRHTVGTRLLQKGVSLDKVQMILGHENISTTRRYARTAPEAVLEPVAKAEKIKEAKAIYRYWI